MNQKPTASSYTEILVYRLLRNTGAQRGARNYNVIMAEELPRLRATRAANKGMITKLIGESEAILETDTEIDDKTRNRLIRIETKLKEKIKLVTDLDENIMSVCKLENIEKEIDDAKV